MNSFNARFSLSHLAAALLASALPAQAATQATHSSEAETRTEAVTSAHSHKHGKKSLTTQVTRLALLGAVAISLAAAFQLNYQSTKPVPVNYGPGVKGFMKDLWNNIIVGQVAKPERQAFSYRCPLNLLTDSERGKIRPGVNVQDVEMGVYTKIDPRGIFGHLGNFGNALVTTLAALFVLHDFADKDSKVLKAGNKFLNWLDGQETHKEEKHATTTVV